LWSAPVNVTPNETLTVTGPLGTLSGNRPTLEWTSVAGAQSYEVWLDLVGGDSNPILNPTVNGTSYQVDTGLATGEYRTWVRANLSGGTTSDWASATFQVTGSTVVSLPTTKNLPRPTITWDAVTGATGYRVFVTNVTAGQSGFIDEIVTGTSFTPAQDFTLGRNRIWIRPVIDAIHGTWSVGVDYDITSQAVGPTGSGTELQPQFSWTAVPGAASYQLYVAGPGGVLINQSGISGTAFTPATPLATADFQWWVRPSLATGEPGPWSEMAEFSTGDWTHATVSRQTQSDNIASLQWPDVPGAVGYDLYLSREGQPGAYLRQNQLDGNSASMPPLPNGNYKVWIRTAFANGTTIWGRGVAFTVAAQTSGNAVIPLTVNGPGFDKRPILTWQSAAGAVSYDVLLHAEQMQLSQTVSGTTYQPDSDLDGEVTWWVRSRNAAGVASPWSSPTSFNTTGRTVVQAPASSASPFQWQPVRGATRYSLQVNNLSTGTANVIREDNLNTTSFTPAASFTAGEYRVWVRAISGNNTLAPWSVPVDFTIADTGAEAFDLIPAINVQSELLLAELNVAKKNPLPPQPVMASTSERPTSKPDRDVSDYDHVLIELFTIPNGDSLS